MKTVSAIICTYNPDKRILERCLNAIIEANDVYALKEILLIDNNSTSPLEADSFIQSCTRKLSILRVISESQQGLTYARIAGIANSSGELLIFIDDDNIIRKDYFLEAVHIADEFPFIGVFGGQVQLIYDQQPPTWTERYWGGLVHRLFTGNHWGNTYFDNSIMPNGAGLCVTREVAMYYKSLQDSGKRKITLDRSGGSLMSGGDNDLAMCACDISKGMGLFEKLYLEHFIPQGRFTLDYLTRLTQGIYYSSVLLKQMRTGQYEVVSRNRRILDFIRSLSMKKEDVIMQKAMYKGLNDAYTFLESQKNV